MMTTTFNPTQLQLLKIFSVQQSEESAKRLKRVLFEYYCAEVERLGEQLVKEKNMTNEKLEALSNEHFRLKK